MLCLTLTLLMFLVLFSIVISSFGEERTDRYASRVFCFILYAFLYQYVFPLGVRGCLRLVIVVRPAGLFSQRSVF